MQIRVRITGRSYHAAAAVPAVLSLPEAATVRDALAQIQSLLPAEARLAPSCLVAVGGTHLGTLADEAPHPLRDGDELLLVVPVAGG